MEANLLKYYCDVLERLINLPEVTKAMSFHLLQIDDEEELEKILKMSDEELLNRLR